MLTRFVQDARKPRSQSVASARETAGSDDRVESCNVLFRQTYWDLYRHTPSIPLKHV